jgi:hypothetical protein
MQGEATLYQLANKFFCTHNKICITPPSGEISPNGENKDAYSFAHSDSGVRLWRLSHGTWAWLLRRRRHQSYPAHRSDPASHESYIAVQGPFPHYLSRRMGQSALPTKDLVETILATRYDKRANAYFSKLGPDPQHPPERRHSRRLPRSQPTSLS